MAAREKRELNENVVCCLTSVCSDIYWSHNIELLFDSYVETEDIKLRTDICKL